MELVVWYLIDSYVHGTKSWIYSKFDLDQKSGSNMIIALIQTLTRVKCVSKMFMALPIHLILDKEEGKCDLNFDSTFEARQRRNQISYEFAMHLIPAKGEVKHVNTFDSSFDARKRHSKTPRLCIPLISYVKGVQRRHGFVQL